MRKIDSIYIHCSYSDYGNKALIRKWHVSERGWSDIGYHVLVYNAFPTFGDFSRRLYSTHTDGQVVMARPLSHVGSHVKGSNATSVGICYIGKFPTSAQYNALLMLCTKYLKRYKLKVEDVKGHYEANAKKSCPNFSIDTFREVLKLQLAT